MVIMMRQYFIGLFFIFGSSSVMAEWQILSGVGPTDSEQYIDLQNVKQTGPMAIYRQVQVLSQGAAVSTNGVLSTLALYEYDCMNTKFRLLDDASMLDYLELNCDRERRRNSHGLKPSYNYHQVVS